MDDYFPVNHIDVMATETDKTNITDFGPPEKFAESVGFLLGKQAYSGDDRSAR